MTTETKTEYAVWIEVEELDEHGDGETVDCCSFGRSATVDTLDEARELAEAMEQMPRALCDLLYMLDSDIYTDAPEYAETVEKLHKLNVKTSELVAPWRRFWAKTDGPQNIDAGLGTGETMADFDNDGNRITRGAPS